MTTEQCNAWECEHNKNGYCESEDAFTECQDKLLEMIAEYKLKEKGYQFDENGGYVCHADLSNGNDFYSEKEVRVNGK